MTYEKGEDETQVQYKSFNARKSDVYPSIALCLSNAIDDESLKEYGENLTAKDYSLFLLGQHWDKSMLNIDYERVVKRWDEHILGYGYNKKDVNNYHQGVTLYTSNDAQPTRSKIMPGFKELSVGGMKCLTIDILFEKDLTLFVFGMFLKPEIFLHGRRPSALVGNPFESNGFIVNPHYPKQALRFLTLARNSWPARGKHASKSYTMHFFVRGTEVLERRNKYRYSCTMGFPDFDNLIKESVLNEIGCKPPYWNSSSLLPLCTNQKKMSKANNLINKLLYSDAERYAILKSLPCRGLERIQYDFVDDQFNNEFLLEYQAQNGSLAISFEFMESTYKELKHVRSMDLQALIGN